MNYYFCESPHVTTLHDSPRATATLEAEEFRACRRAAAPRVRRLRACRRQPVLERHRRRRRRAVPLRLGLLPLARGVYRLRGRDFLGSLVPWAPRRVRQTPLCDARVEQPRERGLVAGGDGVPRLGRRDVGQLRTEQAVAVLGVDASRLHALDDLLRLARSAHCDEAVE